MFFVNVRMSRGPNFREKNSININIAKEEIKKGIEEYVDKWSARNRKPKCLMNEWKHALTEKINQKIDRLIKGPLKTWKARKKILNDMLVKQSLPFGE